MKIEKKDPNEYGVQLDFRLIGQHQIQTQEFWGEEAGRRALDYLAQGGLRSSTDYHRFQALIRPLT